MTSSSRMFIPLILMVILHTSLHSTEVIPSSDSTSTNDTSSYSLIPWGASGLFMGISFSKQANEYWSESSPFYVMDWKTEYDDALLADKLGHAAFAYTTARTLSGLFMQCGYEKRTATWIGSGLSLFHQSVVEYHDGYSAGAPYLGFSRGDFIANIIGVALPIAQEYVPALDIIRFKFSFLPGKDFNDHGENPFNDYQATYHWLSFNIAGVFPENQREWSRYVNIAVGHSVKNIDRYGSGNHEFYLSLDFNAEALPFDDSWGLALKRILNTIKFPMPCIKLYPNIVWYGVRI
ncbi:MAG: DUF2279 domain-containing protein [Ignavibacteria bacterium]|nr:DUF2279 domain-containing protein [Ignavibacteria bacterium]